MAALPSLLPQWPAGVTYHGGGGGGGDTRRQCGMHFGVMSIEEHVLGYLPPGSPFVLS